MLGQAIASSVMILGYSTNAVPTAIMSAEMMSTGSDTGMECQNCHATDHLSDAVYCRKCGTELQR